jgi:hypothetical protein
VVGCLALNDVKCALAEPGGHLLVRDGDLITYNRETLPPPEGQEPNIAASLQGTSNVANINRIFAGEALKRGFVVGCVFFTFESRTQHVVDPDLQTFLSFTKDARGSLLYSSIFSARLCAVWKLLRLLQGQERDAAPVGIQGFQYRELHADLEYDIAGRNKKRALGVS